MLFLENLLLISSKGRIFMQVIIYLPTGQSVGLINESHFAYLTYRVVTGAWWLSSIMMTAETTEFRFRFYFPLSYYFPTPCYFILTEKWKFNIRQLQAVYKIVQNSQPVSHFWISQPTKLICFKSGYFENDRPPSKMSFMDIVIETDCFFSFI